MEDVHTVFLKADCPLASSRAPLGRSNSWRSNRPRRGIPCSWSRWRRTWSIWLKSTAPSDCFLEIDRKGCRVIQLGDLRITSAWPPFSDAREITVVRPVAKLSLGDYDLDQRLVERLRNHHRGVFICGRPGSGKTTLAQAIAEYLDTDVGALVKTMEAPRDLQLADRITQYAPLEGDLEKTAEIIFLVRPISSFSMKFGVPGLRNFR